MEKPLLIELKHGSAIFTFLIYMLNGNRAYVRYLRTYFPTRFLNILLKFFLPAPIFILFCAEFWHSFVK